jgi:hypothetical protein
MQFTPINLDGKEYDEISDAYYDLSNHTLVPAIQDALILGIKKYRSDVKADENDGNDITADLDGKTGELLLYYGEDETEGEPFFKHVIGQSLVDCLALLTKMDEMGGGTSFRHGLSNLFEDACPSIDEKNYEDLDITLWVEGVGGDPYIEEFNA